MWKFINFLTVFEMFFKTFNLHIVVYYILKRTNDYKLWAHQAAFSKFSQLIFEFDPLLCSVEFYYNAKPKTVMYVSDLFWLVSNLQKESLIAVSN